MTHAHTEAAAPSTETKCELGVLFIHGIGYQKRGETLLAFGEPLCRWFEASLDASIEIRQATLDSDPDDGAAPAHVDISLWYAGRPRECVLAESCWAGSFPTPAFGDVARWALLALPWTLAAQLARRFRPAMGEQGGMLRHYPRFAVDAVVSFATFFLGACLELVVLALLALSVIPVSGLRDFILRLQMRIAGLIGDSYALLDSPIRSAAIVEKVRRDLEWLSRRTDRIAIVAHSQGAAVAHKLIAQLFRERSASAPGATGEPRRHLLDAVALYFSFGSGLGKLHDIQQAFRAGGNTLRLGFGLMAAVLVLPVLLPVALLTGRGPSLLLGFAFMLSFVAFLAIVVIVAYRNRSSEDDRKELELSCFRLLTLPALDRTPDHGTIRWVDCYSSWDPVPSGPLRGGESSWIDSRRISNGGGLLFDHVTYWRNRDEFVRLLVAELGWPPTPSTRGEDSSPVVRRRWRLEWLFAFQIIGVLSVLVLIAGLWPRLDPIGLAIVSAIRTLAPGLAPPASQGLARALGGAALAGVAWLWFQVAAAAHRRWERRDFKRTAARKPFDEGGLPFLTFVAVATVLPVLAIVMALLDFNLDRAAAWWRPVWEAREAIGFGSVISPVLSAMVALLPWFLVVRADHTRKSTLHGEAFVQSWLAVMLVSFMITVPLGIAFPGIMRPLPAGGSLLQQLAQSLAVFGPYVVAGALVALTATTLGPAMSKALTRRSEREPSVEARLQPKPWSIHSIAWISVGCAGGSLLLRWLVEYFHLGAWGVVALTPLWFVAALAAANAFGREVNRDQSEAASNFGSSLGSVALLAVFYAIVWPVWVR